MNLFMTSQFNHKCHNMTPHPSDIFQVWSKLLSWHSLCCVCNVPQNMLSILKNEVRLLGDMICTASTSRWNGDGAGPLPPHGTAQHSTYLLRSPSAERLHSSKLNHGFRICRMSCGLRVQLGTWAGLLYVPWPNCLLENVHCLPHFIRTRVP